MDTDARRLLRIYLHDHLGGAAAGVALARRAASSEANSEIGSALRKLASDIQFDRKQLRSAIQALGLSARAPLHESVGWFAERLGRLKLNGRLVTRSPLSRLLEVEGLQAGVRGKRGVWMALKELQRTEPGLAGFDIDIMIARADQQEAVLRDLHTYATRTAFDLTERASRRGLPAAETARA